MEGALGAIQSSIEDTDAGVRSAAVQALGALGGDKQAADLVNLLQQTQNPKDRANIEKALAAISGRTGATCVPCLLPLMQNSDAALRTIGLRALAIAGGPGALAAVKSALEDKDETVQDEAARTLSTWPNNWPGDTAAAEALLSLVKSGKNMLHQVLGLRGYLEYVRGDKQLNNSGKVAKVNELLPLIQRPEEKRLAISVIGAIRTAGSLELLTTLASDAAVTEDACSAIVNISGRGMQGATREQRQKALQMVVDRSKNDATKKRAEDLLKGVR
jgi:HEAT repeat protein